MKSAPAPRPAAETVAFDSDAYRVLVASFAGRIKKGPVTIVLAGPAPRQRGSLLAELSDAASLPLLVVPMEMRFAPRVAQTLANLREDFDATSSSAAILCFRHADRYLGRAFGDQTDTLPAPFDYIFERARHVKGAVVLSLDDAAAADPLAARADVVVTFEAALVGA